MNPEVPRGKRRRVVERLEVDECDSGSQNKEDGAFSILKICGNLIDFN